MSEASAVDVLAQMHRAGLSTDIRMAFPAEDSQGEPIFRIWTADSAVDVALDEQGLVVLLQNGDRVYYQAENDAPQQNDTPQQTPTDDTKPQMPSPDAEGHPSVDDGDQSAETTLRIISLTSPIEAGKQATLKAVGLPNTEYAISVRYASGESTAKGLENAVSDENGNVSWTFRVASRVAPGEYPISITGGEERVSTTLTVTN
jgi:hypothetical protein